MKFKDVQEQRVRAYFIQATRELLKSEGLKSVSVRSIADRAGYSYATLYNYFTDIQELIFLCVKDFQDECREFIQAADHGQNPGPDRLRIRIMNYMAYFTEYPGIFELFFLERMADIQLKEPVSAEIFNFLSVLTNEDWEVIRSQQGVTEEEIEARKHQMNFLITGLLIFYLNRRQPLSYESFLQLASSQVSRILE